MYECDICFKMKPESQFYSITRSGPPFYDFMCVCNECHAKMEVKNGRKEDNSYNKQFKQLK